MFKKQVGDIAVLVGLVGAALGKSEQANAAGNGCAIGNGVGQAAGIGSAVFQRFDVRLFQRIAGYLDQFLGKGLSREM